MNIKIKAEGVYCLVQGNYEQMYARLKQAMGQSPDFLFTERRPGVGYLQWELPGDGWVSLKEGDPLTADEARRLLVQRREAVTRLFGNNQEMAQRVMSVPDDGYVYYKADDTGHMLIRLTAWGYRYPERVGQGPSTGVGKPKEQTETCTITLLYDGKPVPRRGFRLNGFERQTDDQGHFLAGNLPIGYQFDLEVPDVAIRQHITIMPGQGDIKVDVTEFVSAQFQVTLDAQPCAGARCRLLYNERDMHLTTDATGQAIAKLPLDLAGGMCTATVEADVEGWTSVSEQQQQPLTPPLTVFTFSLVSPERPAADPDNGGNTPDKPDVPETPEPPKAPENPENPDTPSPTDPIPDIVDDREPTEPVQLPKDQRRQFQPHIKVISKSGMISRQYPIVVTIGGVSNSYISDAQGLVQLQTILEGEPMTVADGLIAGNVQQYMLSADQEEYIFMLPYDNVDMKSPVTVTVLDEKGRPLSGATAFFSQKDAPDTIAYLDQQGSCLIDRDSYRCRQPLSLQLTTGQTQMKPIVFELEEDEDGYLVQAYVKPSFMQLLLEVLFALLLILLAAAVYYFCYGALFG